MYLTWHRFISGLGHVGTFMMTFSLALEYVGPKYRTLFGILIETPFALGGLIVGLVSWAGVRDWQLLSLVLSAPNLLLLSYWWLLPESPRWLISANKTEHLMKVLQNAATTNKKTLPSLIESSPSQKSAASKASLLDLFRPTTILIRSMVMFFNWLVVTMCYYGLTSAAATLNTNLYTNFMLAIAVEVLNDSIFLTNHLLFARFQLILPAFLLWTALVASQCWGSARLSPGSPVSLQASALQRVCPGYR